MNNSPSVDNGSSAPPSVHPAQRLEEQLQAPAAEGQAQSNHYDWSSAEAQIKLVESENQGGGRLQEVERLLMEARMANARLMEDNESYQLPSCKTGR